MDRQLVIRPHGELFHVAFHNYMGPFEGHQIGEWLGLEEIEPPEDEVGPEPLREGQYYLWHEMDRHPDLHALVGAGRLGDVARVIDHFHVRVIKGNRFLPEVEPEQPVVETPPPSYVEYIEEEHKPVWAKGPRAILHAVVAGAVPTILVVLALLVVSRHFGDHRDDVGLDEVFRRAQLDPVQQTAFQQFWNPDHSGELRTRLNSVCYIEGERVVLGDGNVLQFDGVGDVRRMMERARSVGIPPQIEIDLVDGRAEVVRIIVGDQELGQGTEIRQLARLPRTAGAPDRSNRANTAGWYQPTRLPLGDTPEMRDMEGRRLCLRGVLQNRDGVLELVCVEGERFWVEPVQTTPGLNAFIEYFADGQTDLSVDVVLDEVFRTSQQEATGVVGRGTLYSASAQNYHIMAAR